MNNGSRRFGLVVGARSHGTVATPNDLKLSDSGVRRGTCMVGGKVAVEAGAVTHGAVRCSAWLGVGVGLGEDTAKSLEEACTRWSKRTTGDEKLEPGERMDIRRDQNGGCVQRRR